MKTSYITPQSSVKVFSVIKRWFLKYWQLYLLLIPAIVLTFIFKYIPMYGVQIAFRDYNAVDGFWGSKWVGLEHFRRFFSNYNSSRMIQNTVLISLYSLVWSFPVPIILSLLINSSKNSKFQGVVCTTIYAPHFISLMVVCGMITMFLSPNGGLIASVLQRSGAVPTNYLENPSNFRTIYIASGIWQNSGWGCIIYLATLSTVDTSLHEAARVDGASAWLRLWHIDIPALIPVVVINLIMSFGSLMNVGFEKAFLLSNDLNRPTSEIIATYVYRQGIERAAYSFSTAVGLFNTTVNIILLIIVNRIAKKAADISFV
jgi:putative aldouronate transport system permease protein